MLDYRKLALGRSFCTWVNEWNEENRSQKSVHRSWSLRETADSNGSTNTLFKALPIGELVLWSFNPMNIWNHNAASQSKTWRDSWSHFNPNLWIIISREAVSSETKLKNETKHDKENKINITQLNNIALTINCAACSFQFQRHFSVRHLFIRSRLEWMFLHLFYFVFISGENKA